jgi:RimJ/RimL family protein N-acetyltransferase
VTLAGSLLSADHVLHLRSARLVLRRFTAADDELGYRLRRAAWGRGYATEMSRVLLAQGFDRLAYERVIARAEVDNAASWRVMEKLGMRRERELSEDGIAVFHYAVDRATWRDPSPAR